MWTPTGDPHGSAPRLHRLSFFSDLIPCLMDHQGGLEILAELAESKRLGRTGQMDGSPYEKYIDTTRIQTDTVKY